MSIPIKKCLAECIGATVLVFVGCGSVAVGSYGSSLPIGALPIALAFGLTVTALIYALGPISGCHINPAVTLALWAAGRFQPKDVPGYVAAQLAGGIAGAGLLVISCYQAYDGLTGHFARESKLEEMNEARNRGWDTIDSRSPMKLQIERAGVTIKCDPAAVEQVLISDKG